MMSDITIRELLATDSISSITALVHASYAPWAKRGLRVLSASQSDEVTAGRLARGNALVALCADQIVGTATLYAPTPESLCAWYRNPGTYYFGQLAVHPDYQRQGIGSRLLDAVHERAAEREAVELALDTAAENKHLLQWYVRLGFRFIQGIWWPETNYRSVVLSKKLRGNRPAQ